MLSVFIILWIIDWVSTVMAVQRGAIEGNPTVRFILNQNDGWFYYWLYKMSVLALVIVINSPLLAGFGNAIMSAVLVNNYMVMKRL